MKRHIAQATTDELVLSEAAKRKESGQIDNLTPEQEEQVEKLTARDREVRAHEQAHLNAAGPYALGGPTYTYQKGPDGKNYAVGGQVQIDTSPVKGDPEATIQKARVVRQAALAPAEPSAQDRKVAASASKLEQQARVELREKQAEKSQQEHEGTEPGSFLDLFA